MALPLALLPGLAFAADVATRQEAIRGSVISEPDYMSTWLTTLRNNWRMLGGTGFTHMQTLPKPAETLTGCDAVFFLESDDPDPFKKYWKILLIESKKLNPRMDYYQLPSLAAQRMYPTHPASIPISHFSDQIGRQQDFLNRTYNEVAIAEMFQNFGPSTGPYPSPAFNQHGSTFAEHDDAWNHVNDPQMTTLNLWGPADAETIVDENQTIQWLLNEMLACRIGNPMNVIDIHKFFARLIGREYLPKNELPPLPGDRDFQDIALHLVLITLLGSSAITTGACSRSERRPSAIH